MINFKKISKIFSQFLDNTLTIHNNKGRLDQLIRSNIEVNRRLWDLEDIARMHNLDFEHVALAKQEIDKNNQTRNNLVQKIDVELEKVLKNNPSGPIEKFYGESPGMVIDRLAILFIKLSVIKKMNSVIEEKDLKREYLNKEKVISNQINKMGNFLDLYFLRIQQGEVFFEIQQPVKIYNDNRIKKYIKILKKNGGGDF